MNLSLFTPVPSLESELGDILRLFYPSLALTVNEHAPDEDATIRHTLAQEGDTLTTVLRYEGAVAAERTASCTLARDPSDAYRQTILRKRQRKRLSKQTLYDLLRELTGVRPPWGSLTGIRPTRLTYEALAEGRTLAEAEDMLARVFDVLPEKAALLSDIVRAQAALPAPDPTLADVYVGIPFCRTRCAYCSFPGEKLTSEARTEAYLAALLREMADASRVLHEGGWGVRALYVGGGTPSALNAEQLNRVVTALIRLFPFSERALLPEFTVEAGRPDTIDRDKLAVLRDVGVTRVSVNPQTMNDDTLARIGRAHTAAETEAAFALCRAEGFNSINMDVIAALPGETPEDFARTLARIRALSPESLTVHTLAIKRASRLHLENARLPSPEVAQEMTRLGAEAARGMGMTPYYLYRQKYMAGQQQNVGYALPGHLCLYNVDIMEETTSIVALGAGAISKRVFPDRELRIERAPNVSNVTEYIDRVDEMAARKRVLFS